MKRLIALGVALSFGVACASKRTVPELATSRWDGSAKSVQRSRTNPVVSTRGMVVSDDELASEWGAEILRSGGNAVDAAVGTAFVLSVTRPHFGSLGGGGFFLFCKSKPEPCQIIDYREVAPIRASRDMYTSTEKSQDGALASGVPGVTAGLLMALQRFGTLPRERVLKRAIELARNGIRVSGYTEAAADERWGVMNDEAKRVFGCGSREHPCEPGAILKQPDLAHVLEKISREGRDGFYKGEVAEKIAHGVQAGGGIISKEDLRDYAPKLRTPLRGSFEGYEVDTMPPPSSGGILLLQMLGYAERADASGELKEGFGAADTIHALAHGMGLAFADRTQYAGDSDFFPVPSRELLSKEYLDSRWSAFRREKQALPEQPGKILSVGLTNLHRPIEGPHTTHFSVIDRDGNAVAITTTINDNFGSGFVPPGTGVVMNNEMDDFSIKPGVPNLFGLVGGDANSIAAGKRPLSSMSPTVLRDANGSVRMVLGAAGGPRIPSAVFLTIINRFKFGMSLTDAVAAARFHEQWNPTTLTIERSGWITDVIQELADWGYDIKLSQHEARIQALERFPNARVWGAPDPRGEGYAARE